MSQNELEDGAGLNQILSRAFGVQGAAAPFMASEVFPVLVMGNDRPEWQFLSGDRLASGFHSDAAIAAQRSHVGINNPAGSGAICVVESIIVSGISATVAIAIGKGAVIDSAAGQKFFRDTRLPIATGGPTCDLYDTTQAGALGATVLTLEVGAVALEVKGPWILAPDGFLLVRGGTAVAVSANFIWREYAAANGELRNIA